MIFKKIILTCLLFIIACPSAFAKNKQDKHARYIYDKACDCFRKTTQVDDTLDTVLTGTAIIGGGLASLVKTDTRYKEKEGNSNLLPHLRLEGSYVRWFDRADLTPITIIAGKSFMGGKIHYEPFIENASSIRGYTFAGHVSLRFAPSMRV
jgi:hypothetical protein